MRKIQAEVLESYSKIVKPGGKMVYATCSILPSENQDQIAKFLATDIGKSSTSSRSKNSASESGFDGFWRS
jgi:16S rRNA (cytosine967-C5)-methyltransferase